MKSALKLALMLTVWSVIACCALALVNSFTAPIIEARTAETIKNALTEIFPEASTNESIIAELSSDNPVIKFDNAYAVKSNAGALGIVITATGPTYNASTIMVGIDLDGNIKTIKFISNNDTKGIGSKVVEPHFTEQFNGKNARDAFKVAADVDGVSGATVSSKGVAKILKTACTSGIDYLKAHNLLREAK